MHSLDEDTAFNAIASSETGQGVGGKSVGHVRVVLDSSTDTLTGPVAVGRDEGVVVKGLLVLARADGVGVRVVGAGRRRGTGGRSGRGGRRRGIGGGRSGGGGTRGGRGGRSLGRRGGRRRLGTVAALLGRLASPGERRDLVTAGADLEPPRSEPAVALDLVATVPGREVLPRARVLGLGTAECGRSRVLFPGLADGAEVGLVAKRGLRGADREASTEDAGEKTTFGELDVGVLTDRRGGGGGSDEAGDGGDGSRREVHCDVEDWSGGRRSGGAEGESGRGKGGLGRSLGLLGELCLRERG